LGIFFVVQKGEAFCVRPFALHRQKPEKDKQNVDSAPLENFLRTPMTIVLIKVHTELNKETFSLIFYPLISKALSLKA